MKRHRALWIAAFLVGCIAVMTGAVVAAPEAHTVDRWVLGATAHGETAGLTLDGTYGQPLAGFSSGGDMDLSSGFWFPLWAEYTVYLPIVFTTE